MGFGCRQVKMQFPVKLTEPVTAILYISPDKKHLDDLRHAIHVHEVGEGKLYNFQLLHCLRVIFGVTLLAETSSTQASSKSCLKSGHLQLQCHFLQTKHFL